MKNETITISKNEYDRLVKRDDWLECLEAAGVDNWQGIEYAIALRREGAAEDDGEDA